MGLWDSFLDRFRPTTIDFQDLMKSSAELLGKGRYGTVYTASMDKGEAVAVKRFMYGVVADEEEFKAMVELIGSLDHENLLPLRAFYFSRNDRFLVYDYFPLGSLSAILHGMSIGKGGASALNWERRAKIALGTARGVQYIHSQGPTSCHGNIKSSNIFLSKNYEARVSDFGIAQVASPWAPHRDLYRAPEVTDPREVSQKADVYSFGVLIVELLTGKVPIVNEEVVNTPIWLLSVMREEWSPEIFDPPNVPMEVMDELFQLAHKCVSYNPETRPTMANTAARIERICGCSSSSDKPYRADLKVAPQDLSLQPRKRGSG